MIPCRSQRLSNVFTTKPGTPEHAIVLELTKKKIEKQTRKKIKMNYKKTNTSNMLKILIQGPIRNMKPKGVYLQAMISYLH